MKKERSIITGLLIAVSLMLVIGCDTEGGKTTTAAVTYAIGDPGPAGGLIFYIDEANAYSWTYLEVAPASTEWVDKEWGDNGTFINGDATLRDIGDGQAATDAIVTHMEGKGLTDTAAQLCDALSYNGFDDWFLPSRGEILVLWHNLVDDGAGHNSGVGGFARAHYWSSTEESGSSALHKLFSFDIQYYYTKDHLFRVRAIRAF